MVKMQMFPRACLPATQRLSIQHSQKARWPKLCAMISMSARASQSNNYKQQIEPDRLSISEYSMIRRKVEFLGVQALRR